MRLQSQANPVQEPEMLSCKLDIDALNEKSQQWKRTWPDSVEGHVFNVGVKMKEKAAKDLAEIEAVRNRPKYDNSEVMKKAREIIFEKSNYGQLLISAVAESKALEDREVQIQFKTQIKEEAKRIEESQAQVKNIMYAEFDKGDVSKLLSKQRMIENAQFNKAIAKMKTEDASKAARIEKMHCEEDMEMIEKLRQLEILEQNNKPCFDEEGVKKYEAHRKMMKEHRARREALDEDVADIWKKYYERVRCKEQQMLRQIHREKHNSKRYKDVYEMVLRLQNEEDKKYNDFVEKGVNECRKRLEKREKEEQLKQRRQLSKIAQAQRNKAEEDNQRADRAGYKCYCDRQTILRRTKDKKEKKASLPTPKEPKPFLQPYKRVPQSIPAGWSQFAGAAGTSGPSHASCRNIANSTV